MTGTETGRRKRVWNYRNRDRPTRVCGITGTETGRRQRVRNDRNRDRPTGESGKLQEQIQADGKEWEITGTETGQRERVGNYRNRDRPTGKRREFAQKHGPVERNGRKYSLDLGVNVQKLWQRGGKVVSRWVKIQKSNANV